MHGKRSVSYTSGCDATDNKADSVDGEGLQISACLFDLDGTLLDTLNDLADSMNRVLAAMGFPCHPTGAYRHFVGDGMSKLVERVLPENASSFIQDECRERMMTEYANSWAVKTAPYPGIIELLGFIEDRSLPMAVFSNKPDQFTIQMCRHFFPGTRFASVHGFREEIPRKPDPAGALATAKKMGIPTGQVLYLGDTATDMRCARGAGMIATGVLWGFRDRVELVGNGAELIVTTPDEVREIIS